MLLLFFFFFLVCVVVFAGWLALWAAHSVDPLPLHMEKKKKKTRKVSQALGVVSDTVFIHWSNKIGADDGLLYGTKKYTKAITYKYYINVTVNSAQTSLGYIDFWVLSLPGRKSRSQQGAPVSDLILGPEWGGISASATTDWFRKLNSNPGKECAAPADTSQQARKRVQMSQSEKAGGKGVWLHQQWQTGRTIGNGRKTRWSVRPFKRLPKPANYLKSP